MTMTANWQRALRENWGVDANLTLLASEFDLNFLADTDDGEGFILKVMRPDCDAEFVDMQIAALDHIASNAPDLPFPRIVRSTRGEKSVRHEDSAGENRLLWLLARLPGRTLAATQNRSAGLVTRLGRAIGASDVALLTFRHEALTRDLKWNLAKGLWIRSDIAGIADGGRRAILEQVVADFSGIGAALENLPEQAIHNDFNDHNVLVSGTLCEPRRISGLIDPGDMCLAPRICNLAIAGAYLVLDAPDPEARLVALVAGYHAANPLRPDEVDLIWPLLRMRLAVSVVNSARMARENPDDPYVVISQAPA